MANLHDKTEYVIHIKSLKQILNYELVWKKVHRVIKFNQDVWLKPHNNMKIELRKKAKNDFEKGFLSWWTMQFLEKWWKKLENIEILNLPQQKEEETIWCQNQINTLQFFCRISISNRNEKNWNTYG